MENQILPHVSDKSSLMDTLVHHVGDSAPLIKLPEIFGIDFSITKHVIIMWIIAALLILLITTVARAVKRDKSATGGRLSILVQIFLEFINKDVVEPNFRKEGKKFLPFFSTLFFFIMFCNLFGLFPGSATITGNLSVTLALSIITFIFILSFGIRNHGFFKFWVSIVPSGVPKALWPLMFVIEFLGLITKPSALMIRLFANMIAGHIVILVLLFLTKELFVNNASLVAQIGVPPLTVLAAVAVNLLEIFIALLQAYIFTFLSAIFISEAGHGH